jgi:hypothetical protein
MLVIYPTYAILSFKRRRGWLRERRRDVVPNRNIWISPVPIQKANSMTRKVSAMWSPTGRIEPEVPARRDSFCAGPAAKPFRAAAGRPSSIFEVPRRKSSWASGYWPRGWGFEAPPESWRSNSIPSGGGWPQPLCIVNRSVTCWFEISTFPRFKWMNFGPSLKKTPKSHWADHPKNPLLAKKGRGRSLGSTWIWRAFAPEFRLRLASLVGNRTLYSTRRLLRKIHGCLNGTLPLFTSDSLPHYGDVLLELYGQWEKPNPTGLPGPPYNLRRVASADLRYAQVHKERQSGRWSRSRRTLSMVNGARCKPKRPHSNERTEAKARLTRPISSEIIWPSVRSHAVWPARR